MPPNTYLIFVRCFSIVSYVLLTVVIAVQSETSSQPHIRELLSSLAPSQAPQTRSKAKNGVDKPAVPNAQKDLFEFTPLKSLFIDGMDEEQIWAQLDLRTKAVCRMLDYVLEGVSEERDEEEVEEDSEEEDDTEERLRKAIEALESGEDIDMEELMAKYGLDEEDMDALDNLEDEEDSEADSDSDEASSEDEEEGEEEMSLLRDSEVEESKQSSSRAPITRITRPKKKGSKFSELDDGFFDLDEFNAETERAESKSSSRGRLAGDDDSDEDDMDVDLFAPVDDASDIEEEDSEGEKGTYINALYLHSPFMSHQNCSIGISSSRHLAQIK